MHAHGKIDEFVKVTHSTNSLQGPNQRILIPSGTVVYLKSIQFKLEDDRKYNALPNSAQLTGKCSQSKEQDAQRRLFTLPDISVPKFNGHNFDNFSAQSNEIVARTYGNYGAPIDYLLRENNRTYTYPWATRAKKLKNYLYLNGSEFTMDSKLYSLFVQFVGTTGHGSNLVIKHKISQNRYLLNIDLKITIIMRPTYGIKPRQQINISLSSINENKHYLPSRHTTPA